MKPPSDNANEVQRMIYATSEREAWVAEHAEDPGRVTATRIVQARDAVADYELERVLRAAGVLP